MVSFHTSIQKHCFLPAQPAVADASAHSVRGRQNGAVSAAAAQQQGAVQQACMRVMCGEGARGIGRQRVVSECRLQITQ